MALLIDKTLLVNTLGFFNVYITDIQNSVMILNNIGSSDIDKTNAENRINGNILKFNKLVNVIIAKGKFTPTLSKFTDMELGNMGIL